MAHQSGKLGDFWLKTEEKKVNYQLNTWINCPPLTWQPVKQPDLPVVSAQNNMLPLYVSLKHRYKFKHVNRNMLTSHNEFRLSVSCEEMEAMVE